MRPAAKTPITRAVAIACICLGLWAFSARGETETAAVFGDWGVWSCWYWPFNETAPPNIYGDGEALARYDAYAGSKSQAWEYAQHGPAPNQPNWEGHCHAWCGASIWEAMPVASRVCGGVEFRPRDLAALMTEAYFNDATSLEISVFRPSPGLLWRYLHQEILGVNPMHGHAMAIIGNLTTHLGEVWNFPIFRYAVNYTQDGAGTCSGTITLEYADDGNPALADALGLSSQSVVYAFTGVTLDATGIALDSGNWAGNDPLQYPTSLWRPYYSNTWTNYVVNPELDVVHLAQILDMFSLGDALNATGLKWTSGGDAGWYGQGATAHDQVSAAQSGAIGNSATSWLQTVVAGPGTISFWWKVSSEPGYDFLKFLIDGQEQPGSISGEVDWQLTTYPVTGAGPHTLAWVYAKDPGDSVGFDCGWLDQVTWTLASAPGRPLLTIVRVGNQMLLTWPTNWTGYILESCDCTSQTRVWQEVAFPRTIVGQVYQVLDAADAGCKLYRLRRP